MKLLSKLASLALAATVVIGVSSCAGNPAGTEQTNRTAWSQSDDGFGLLAAAGHAMGANAPQGPGGRMGPGMGGPGMGGPGMMFRMMKDLNLSDAQKAQFKALFEAARAQHQNQGQKPDFKALHDTLKSAFLADKFDAAGLKAKLAQNLPQPGSHAPEMAANIVKAWGILTPEQQSKVVSHLDEMDQKMQQWKQNHANGPEGEHGPAEHLQKLTEALKLSPDQQAKLKALWQGGQPDRQAMMQGFRQVKQQVLAELKSGHPSAAKIAAILAPMGQKGGQGMLAHIDKMAALHDILTPAQRQQMVTMMEQRMEQFKQHMGQFHGERGKWRHHGERQHGERQNAQ